MRKIVIILSLVVLFNSCNLYDVGSDVMYGLKAGGKELYHHPDFASVENISQYIKDHVTYKVDEVDTWSSPKETMDRGYGDCDDIAILYLNILYIKTGKKGNLLLGYVRREIVSGGDINHAFVEVDGFPIEPTTGRKVVWKVGYRYSFDHVFN